MTVGRSRYCDISLDDPSISRKHMQLKVSRGSVQLIDLGSSNGTIVNGQRAAETMELASGDVLLMGDAEIRLIVEAPLFDDAEDAQDEDSEDVLPADLQTVRLPAAREAPRVMGDATSFLQRASVELAQQAMETKDRPLARAEASGAGPASSGTSSAGPGTSPARPADPLAEIPLTTRPLPTIGEAPSAPESSFADIFDDGSTFEDRQNEKTSPVRLPEPARRKDPETDELTPNTFSDEPAALEFQPEPIERTSPWAIAQPTPAEDPVPDFRPDLPPPSFDLPPIDPAAETEAPLPDIDIDFSNLRLEDPDPLPPAPKAPAPQAAAPQAPSAPSVPATDWADQGLTTEDGNLSDLLLAPDEPAPRTFEDAFAAPSDDLPADLLAGSAGPSWDTLKPEVPDLSLPAPVMPAPSAPAPATAPSGSIPSGSTPSGSTPSRPTPSPQTSPQRPPASTQANEIPIDTSPRGRGIEILPSLDNLEAAIGPQMPDLPSPETPTPAPSKSAGATTAIQGAHPAGFWLRLTATLLDSIWILILGLAASLTWDGPTDPRGQELGLMVASGIAFIVLLIGWSFWGTTPGKRLLGLYICRDDDNPGIGVARTLLRLVGYGLSSVLLGIGFLLVAFHPDKKGLHDLISGTRVVRS